MPSLTSSLWSTVMELRAKLSHGRRPLAALRQAWGRDPTRETRFDLIELYYAALPRTDRMIDDQTWHDLGMDEVFRKLDRAVGMPGRQVLYARLRTYAADDEVLVERSRQYALFRADASFRENLQLVLGRLAVPGMEWVAPLIHNPLPARPRYVPLLRMLSLASLACLVGIGFHGLLVVPALILVLTNAVIHLRVSQTVSPYFRGFSKIEGMLGAAEELAAVENRHRLPEIETLRGSLRSIAALRKRLAWFSVDRQAIPEVFQALLEYLNIFLLFDLLLYFRSLRKLTEFQSTVVTVYEAVGSLDATIATASYIEGLPSVATPTLVDERRLEVEAMVHPLIRDPVGNSVTLPGRSALIAGPNMAGKTTFIRTIGLNLILAQTLHLCLAKAAVLPRLLVRSAIRREDNLLEGQSYFFAEIDRIREFIAAGADGSSCVVLIDEIYRGTNTVERIAASAAVLRHLAQRHLVLATTHDLELQRLLADSYDMYHFADRVVDGRYGFDYRLRPGAVYSRNAIRLLALSGYPPEVTAEAESLAENLSQPSSPPRAE